MITQALWKSAARRVVPWSETKFVEHEAIFELITLHGTYVLLQSMFYVVTLDTDLHSETFIM